MENFENYLLNNKFILDHSVSFVPIFLFLNCRLFNPAPGKNGQTLTPGELF